MKLFTLIGPFDLMGLYLLMEKITALQQMIDKKNNSCLFTQFCSVLNRINFVHGAFEDLLSETKFVKLRQTIHIC